MDLNRQIETMDKEEAVRCLNGVLEGLAATSSIFGALLSSPDGEDLSRVVTDTAAQLNVSVRSAISERTIRDREEAVRIVLKEMAANPELRPRIENWLQSHTRAELFEPITTALV